MDNQIFGFSVLDFRVRFIVVFDKYVFITFINYAGKETFIILAALHLIYAYGSHTNIFIHTEELNLALFIFNFSISNNRISFSSCIIPLFTTKPINLH